jgi:NDP-sugar pyrophosphorylase family protein
MTNLSLLVLAAGMGSRYGGLKQIDPIGPEGETLMDYSIYDARRAGFDRVVFVIRKEIEQTFKEAIGARYETRIPVEYVFQELGKLVPGAILQSGRTKPWGTTHAILMAAHAIHEPFAVINADDFYGAEGYRALAHHLQAGSPDYAMVGYTLRNTLSDFGAVSRGLCHVDAKGFLQDIAELKSIERNGGHAVYIDESGVRMPLTGDEIVSMNMWGFTPRVFDQIHANFRKFLDRSGSDLKAECYIPSTMNELIQTGEARVKVLRTVDEWFGVTYREDRPRAVDHIHRLIEGGYYPRRLWA